MRQNIFEVETYKIESEHQHFSDIIPSIPTDVIIDKTITGIGATYCELTDKRNSIIVMPNVASIISKASQHKDSFAVYERTSLNELNDYIKNTQGFQKLLTTPESLRHVITGCAKSDINPYKKYFLLLDEAHKLIQDKGYRPNITMAMDYFFKFENKAMVSATVLEPSDPRFQEQGFKILKLQPTFPYNKPIEVLFQNNHLQALKEVYQRNPYNKQCIFFNSINGIRDIIQKLALDDVDLLSESSIFCSAESKTYLEGLAYPKVFNHFDPQHMSRFNFFTSSFYNALDIDLEEPVQIILLTVRRDFKTYFDPYTDAIQAIGRFRKQKDKPSPIKDEVIHIVDGAKIWHYKTTDEVENELKAHQNVYDTLLNLYKSNPNYEEREIYHSSLKRLLFHDFLVNDKHLYPRPEDAVENNDEYSRTYEIDHFKIDNFLHTERVKSYYADIKLLWDAYHSVGIDDIDNSKHSAFDVFMNSRHYDEGNTDEQLLQLNLLKGKRYTKEKVKMILEYLHVAQDFVAVTDYDVTVSKLTDRYSLVRSAYDKLGYRKVIELDYNITKIKRALIDYDVNEGKNKEPLIDYVYIKFALNKRIPLTKIKTALQEIYTHHKIQARAKATDLHRWFDLKEVKIVTTVKSNDDPPKTQRKEERAYILLTRKFPLHRNLTRT